MSMTKKHLLVFFVINVIIDFKHIFIQYRNINVQNVTIIIQLT